MVDPWIIVAFVPAALALNLTPGADMMFCLGQGLRSGSRAAVAASAGIALGAIVHVTVAGLGLGALIAAAPWLFDVIRWVGVAYLLWLAWGAFRGGDRQMGQADFSPRRAFRAGLFVNLANPKVILFVLAFVPQFVDPTGPVLAQFLLFGGILSLGGFVINGVVGIFAGRAGGWLSRGSRPLRWLDYASGSIFSGLAVRLAFLER